MIISVKCLSAVCFSAILPVCKILAGSTFLPVSHMKSPLWVSSSIMDLKGKRGKAKTFLYFVVCKSRLRNQPCMQQSLAVVVWGAIGPVGPMACPCPDASMPLWCPYHLLLLPYLLRFFQVCSAAPAICPESSTSPSERRPFWPHTLSSKWPTRSI